MSIDTPHEMGKKARAEGLGLRACPFPFRSIERKRWRNGWSAVDKEYDARDHVTPMEQALRLVRARA